MSVFITAHRARFGVAPICRVLSEHGCPIAPQTYYGALRGPPSARAVRDEQVLTEIRRVHEASNGLYGARKVYHQLRRDGGVGGVPVPVHRAAADARGRVAGCATRPHGAHDLPGRDCGTRS